LSVAFALLIAVMGCGRAGTVGGPERREKSPGLTASTPAPAIRFQDVTAESGVRFRYANGEESGFRTVLEYVGGGVGMLDLDLDGVLDLCFAGGGDITADRRIRGVPSRLFRQLPASLRFADVTDLSGLDSHARYSHGVAVCDFNNDGFSDVLLTGWQGPQLWQNQGDGTLEDVTGQAGLSDSRWCTGAAWGDLNQDGAADLYVARYVNWSWENHPACVTRDGAPDICNPRTFEPLPDSLYFSDQSGAFRDVSGEHAIRGDGRGLGVLIADFDDDRDSDIYVANDMNDNFLYENVAGQGLREVGMISGTAVSPSATPDGSMGVDLGDFDDDGRPDLWVTNYERQLFAMYRNCGTLSFVHASEASGLADAVGNRVGWGTVFLDLDLDGDMDLYSSAGHPHFDSPDDRRQLPLLLENLDSRTFRNVSATVADDYFQTPQNARGVAAADLDNDGSFDIVAVHLKTDAVILRNTSAAASGWLGFRLVGRNSNRDATGASIEVRMRTGRLVRRFLSGGGSYLSTPDRRVVIAVREGDDVEGATVFWPDGTSQPLSFTPNGYITAIQQHP
jgi:enediyne biosynthesis protein E4